ncbi:MAG: PTS sugar transporter subunit IIA [Candidatus Cloacimonetes bacterium]|jgi:lichenan operon transcriptional antiterminator|nr:PTS sugar transporter subunit IIA [Candidatus Cloacimonadota bacterium]NLO43567.1 PTS transporter subunit EIIA [Candidatus Cloacimonadota bacterium]
MLLASLLNPKTILHLPKAESKESLYREMVDLICKKHQLSTCGDELYKMVMERETQMPTAYKTGIAIPHIRVEGFKDTVLSMAFLEEPLDYSGTPINWVCLVFSDKSSSNLYLNLVAALLKISKDQEMMQALLEAHGGAQTVHIIKKEEIRIKQDITVADIMVTDIVSAKPGDLLSHFSETLGKYSHSCLPVVDESGKFLGEASILNLLKVGVPDYLMMLDNLSFLRAYEPLEKLFEMEDKITVGEIMDQDCPTLRPDASIPEVVFEMIQGPKRFFSVVDKDGILVGVVTAMDIMMQIFMGVVK